jgi:hypothetical protein
MTLLGNSTELALLHEALDIDRTTRQIFDRSEALQSESNGEVITLGNAAVVVEGFTEDSVESVTRSTIDRHIDLLGSIGVNGFGATKESPPSTGFVRFDLGSRPVIICPDITAVLRQRATSPTHKHGFRDYVDEHGMDAALRQFATPSTTKIDFFDTEEDDTPFASLHLGPNSFTDSDTDFFNRWQRPFYVLSNRVRSLAEVSLGQRIQAVDTVTADELIVAAGLNKRFNNTLDVIAEAAGL